MNPEPWITSIIDVAPTVATTASATPDPFGGPDLYGQALVRMLLTLGGFILALLLAARVLPRLMPKYFQRFKKASGSGAIKIMDVCPLNPKVRLYLVRVEEQRFLISVTDNDTTMLGQIPAASAEPNLAGLSTGNIAPAVDSFGEVLRATRPAADR